MPGHDKGGVYTAPRISDQPVPLVPAVEYRCDHCNEPIWISKQRDLSVVRQNLAIWCYRCAAAYVDAHPDERHEVLPGALLDADDRLPS